MQTSVLAEKKQEEEEGERGEAKVAEESLPRAETIQRQIRETAGSRRAVNVDAFKMSIDKVEDGTRIDFAMHLTIRDEDAV